jgi:hypothetical protein
LLQVRMYESVNFKGGSAGAEAVGNLWHEFIACSHISPLPVILTSIHVNVSWCSVVFYALSVLSTSINLHLWCFSSEFAKMLSAFSSKASKDSKLHYMFVVYDVDGDGELKSCAAWAENNDTSAWLRFAKGRRCCPQISNWGPSVRNVKCLAALWQQYKILCSPSSLNWQMFFYCQIAFSNNLLLLLHLL